MINFHFTFYAVFISLCGKVIDWLFHKREVLLELLGCIKVMEGEEDIVPKKKMTKQLTGKREDTLLHSAVRRGNKDEVVEILTRTREDELNELLGKQNQSGETALYVAAEYGDVEIVKEMIKRYDLPLVEIKARNGFDAFHIAAKQGDLGTCTQTFFKNHHKNRS